MTVNFGNGTASKIQVRSLETGKQIEVRPGHFKKLAHSSGSLLVEADRSQKFKFTDVSAFHVDPKYSDAHGSIFGFSYVSVTVLLGTNMQLYVLLPGKKTLDAKVEQPKGYPKIGQNEAGDPHSGVARRSLANDLQ